MERMNLSEEDGKKVEAFPIDRTRGILVPAMEWMIFDEMQNAAKALFDAAMTRAEQDGKVVICGDIKQQDAIATKGLGMHRFLKTWDGIEMRAKEMEETLQQLEMKQKEDTKAVKDIEKVRTECGRLRRAAEAKNKMESKGSTRVVKLDGSRAMRSTTTNEMNDMLDVCVLEHTQKEKQSVGKQELVNYMRDNEQEMKDAWFQREQCGEIREEHYSTGGWSVQQIEHEPQKTDTRVAPVFAAFAGMDLLGKGIKKTFPAGRCVAGSEKNNTARLLFKRQHGFEPFRDQQLVPDYAYNEIFLVTTGAPCVAFSLAGKQNGQTDARGLHYVEQADGYIRAKVPVILFEQVPEARQILSKDWIAKKTGKSPQDQLVEKLRDNGYTVPDGPDGKAGMILNAARLGGVLTGKDYSLLQL